MSADRASVSLRRCELSPACGRLATLSAPVDGREWPACRTCADRFHAAGRTDERPAPLSLRDRLTVSRGPGQ